MSNFESDTENGFGTIENLYIDTLIASVAQYLLLPNGGGGGGSQIKKLERSSKSRMGNFIGMVMPNIVKLAQLEMIKSRRNQIS